MPYIHLTTNLNLSETDKKDIKDYIIKAIEAIPGKSIINTMVQIDEAYMFFKEENKKCIFIEARVYKAQQLEHKQDFVDRMCSYLKEKFDVDKKYIYFNILELDSWVTNGLIK